MPAPALLRSRRGVLAVVVVLLAVAGWQVTAARAHDGVLVGAMYGARCSDAALTRPSSGLRVVVARDMDCRLVTDVSRLGRLPVRLVEIRYPGLGPTGGLLARVDSLRWGGRTYRPVAGEDDAVFRIGRAVPRSGGFHQAVARLSYRLGGCTSYGAVSSRTPVVTLRAYGVRREVSPDYTTYLENEPGRGVPTCDVGED